MSHFEKLYIILVLLIGLGITGFDDNLNSDNRVNSIQIEEEEVMTNMLNIQVGETVLKAKLVENSSTEALKTLLEDGPITINMSDYANMEKVGSFPEKLPTNDVSIRTTSGDLILYQGRQFVIYYDTNSWTFTRLGSIVDVNQSELKEILGSGDVDVILSMGEE